MKTLSDLLYRLFGNTKLRPYVSACLDAWRTELSPEATTILAKQLGLYDFVPRPSADKIIAFLCVDDPRCAKFPADALFPLRSDGTLVAQMLLTRTASTQQDSLRADLFVVDGRLQNFIFSKRPQIVFPRETRREEIQVTHVTVLVDPVKPDLYATSPLADSDGFTGWLRDWAKQWELRDLRKPLPPNARRRILDSLDSMLPADYLEMVAQTEGAQLRHCRINGLSEVWTFVWPQESFYVLSDIEGRGAVGVRQGDRDGLLYYLDNEADGQSEVVGPSLRAMIEGELEADEQSEDGDRKGP